MKKIILCGIILMMLVGCGNLAEDFSRSIEISMKAKSYGTLHICPDEKPFWIGTIVSGACVDQAGLGEFTKIRLRGSTPDEEKKLVIAAKAVYYGWKKCPDDKPFCIGGILGFNCDCVDNAGFKTHMNFEVSQWTLSEQQRGQTRDVENTPYCEPGWKYDTYTHKCVKYEELEPSKKCEDPYVYNANYKSTEDICILPKGRCVFDQDCGTNEYCHPGTHTCLPSRESYSYK